MMALPEGCIFRTLSPLAYSPQLCFHFLLSFFNTFDDIGIGRELFLPESTFTYTAVKCEPSRVLQQADAVASQHAVSPSFRKSELMRSCGFKTCHQANYVFMKEVEQISG